MSTALVILLSLAVAGGLAWMVRRVELSREPKPTACGEVMDKVFGAGANETPDAILLEHLLEHRDACMTDALYVEQVRRLMVNTQQTDQARALLANAERRRTFNADEHAAQVAWVDLAESHAVWANGDEARARELYNRVVESANALRAKWPEWSTPYLILEEAERESWTKPADAPRTDYFQLERLARGRKLNGAYVRSLGDWQPMAYVFVIAALGMLALCTGVSGLVAAREMQHLATVSITEAPPGYVELKGTVHVPRGANPVIGPRTHTPGVWYELESNSGFKNATTTWARSSQPIVLRDASGEAIIAPKDMTVHTRHVDGTFGSSGGLSSNRRESESMLLEGDTVYVLGELRDSAAANGERVRTVSVAQNGKRLLVSNLSEAQLTFMERSWQWLGVGVFAITVVLLAWSYYQRYSVQTLPG